MASRAPLSSWRSSQSMQACGWHRTLRSARIIGSGHVYFGIVVRPGVPGLRAERVVVRGGAIDIAGRSHTAASCSACLYMRGVAHSTCRPTRPSQEQVAVECATLLLCRTAEL